jgi:cytochrome c-type biogenesis protein CcmH
MTAGAAFWVLRAYRRAGDGASSPIAALAACLLVAIVALSVYLVIGRPDLPDAPYAGRLAALAQRNPETYSAEEYLAVLADVARRDPQSALPYLYSGRILLNQDRPAEAARAFDSALRREPQLAEAMIGLGRAVVRMEGRVTPEALTLFQQAGALSDDPVPWMYQAWAAMEAGEEAAARRHWAQALARMGPDDPRRAMAEQFAAGAGR